MRELVLLLAVVLVLGAYFSERRPAHDPGFVTLAEGPRCRHEACRAMRLADPGRAPRVVLGMTTDNRNAGPVSGGGLAHQGRTGIPGREAD